LVRVVIFSSAVLDTPSASTEVAVGWKVDVSSTFYTSPEPHTSSDITFPNPTDCDGDGADDARTQHVEDGVAAYDGLTDALAEATAAGKSRRRAQVHTSPNPNPSSLQLFPVPHYSLLRATLHIHPSITVLAKAGRNGSEMEM
jgi:hypothetical protein